MTENALRPSDITDELLAQYETVIGLEVHCQLLTESKLFTRDFNIFGTEPNTNIGPLTIALPGTLPKVNKKSSRVRNPPGPRLRVLYQPQKLFLTVKITSTLIFRKAIRFPRTKSRFVSEVGLPFPSGTKASSLRR